MIVSIRILMCASLLCIGGFLKAGDGITGRVVNARTGEPVAFVNVGIPQARVGTVSDVELRPVLMRIVQREAVVAEAPKDSEEKILGKRFTKRGYGIGFASGSLGTQIGAEIAIKKPTYVTSANFFVNHTGGGERMLYRVNLYDFTGGEVGENLIGSNVIISGPQRRGEITVDLSEHRIVVRDDVLLALEWVQDDDGEGNANIMFRGKRGGPDRVVFKLTSHLEFRRIIPHTLGFYLTGFELE